MSLIRSCTRRLGVLASLVALAPPAAAQTWTGGGTPNANWSLSTNWSGGVPSSAATTTVTFGGTTNLSPNQNIASPFLLNSLKFNSGSGAFDLVGSGLDFRLNGATAPTIVQNSATAVAVENALTLTAGVTYSGLGSATLSGAIGGTGALTMSGTGTVTLTGTNNFTGSLIANSGVISVSSLANMGNGPTVAIQNGGTLQTTADITLAATLNIGGGGGTLDTNTGTLTIGPGVNRIIGAGLLTKTGTGTLAITATSNAYSGGTAINGGVLTVGADPSLGNIAGGLSFNGGTLQTTAAFTSARTVTINAGNGTFSPSGGDLTLTGAIGGAGVLFVNGSGTVTLSNIADNYAGGTAVINGGTVAISTDANLGAAAGSLILNSGTLRALAGFTSSRLIALNPSGGTVDTNGNDVAISGQVISSGTMFKFGGGTLTLTNATNNYSGGTDIVGGAVAVGADANLGSLTGLVFLAGGTLRTTSSFTTAREIFLVVGSGGSIDTAGNNVTASGLITNSGNLTKLGAGTLTLTNTSNNYTGATSILGGVLSIAAAANLGNTSGLTLDTGTLQVTGSGVTLAQPITLNAGNGQFDVSASLNLTNTIGGGGGLSKIGTGTLTLSGTDNYTGALVISSGVVSVGSVANLGNPIGIVVQTGGTLRTTGTVAYSGNVNLGGGGGIFDTAGGSLTLNGQVFGAGSLTKIGGLVLTLTNVNNDYQGGTFINQSVLTVSTDGNLGAVAGGVTIANNAILQTNAGFTTSRPVALNNGGRFDPALGALVLNGTVTGTGPLTVQGNGTGAGTLTLGSASNSYTGGTSVQSGFLGISADANLGDPGGGLTLNGGTLQALASFTTSRTVTVGAGSGFIDTNGNNVALNGPLTADSFGTLIKLGAGVLTVLNPTYAGHTQVSGGQLVLNGGSLSKGVFVSGGGTLTLNGTTMTPGFDSITAAAGGTIGYSGMSVTGGFLYGPGTHAVLANGASFIGTTSYPSALITQTGPATFFSFTNGGTLTLTTGATLLGFTNQGSGSITVGTAGAINASDFQTYGTLTVNPATITQNFSQTTLMTNAGATPLYFNGGSRAFVGTPGTAVFPSNWPDVNLRGTPTFVAGVDLNGKNAVVAGGLFVNNGYVEDSSNGFAGTSTIVADFGSLVKGAGFFQNTVQTVNGGKFQAGNSPGSASFGHFVLGPGGVSSYVFSIDDATGAAGPTPDAAGHVSGWGLVKAINHLTGTTATSGDFTWTATPADRLTVCLQTLLNPTTVGVDVAGPMDHFDPRRSYSWSAVEWTGSYAGPSDDATLDASTAFDTGGFVNPIMGSFGWRLDPAGDTLSLIYTPSAVPESGTLLLTAVGGFVAVLARRRAHNCAAVTGACLMPCRDVFEQAGRFDESFPLNDNDIDYFMRVRQTRISRRLHAARAARAPRIRDEVRRVRRRIECVPRQVGEAVDSYYNSNLTAETFDYRIGECDERLVWRDR